MSLLTDGFTKLGTLKVPNLGGRTSANTALLIKAADLTPAMISSLRSDWGDLRISTDSGGDTQLPLDIAGTDLAWTKVTSVAVDEIVYIWGNKPAQVKEIDTATFGKHAVWANYAARYHLSQDPSGAAPQISDSSSNSFDLTSFGSMTSADLVPAKIGLGIDFDGVDDDLEASSPVLGSNYSVSCWFKADAVADYALTQARSTTSGLPIQAYLDIRADGSIRFLVRDNAGNIAIAQSPASTYTAGTWVHVKGVRNGNNTTLYVNGNVSDTATNTFGALSVNDFLIGVDRAAGGNKSRFFNGIIDEIGMSDQVHSADFTSIEYQNQSASTAWWIATDSASVTLTSQDVDNSQSLDEPTLNQDYLLILQDLLSGNSLTNVELTSSQDLTVDSLSSGTSLDSPNLSQRSLVTPNKVSSGSNIDNISLTQDSILSVAPLDSGTALDNVALSLSSVLSTINLNSSTSIDLPILSQANILSVESLTTGSSLSEAALVLAGVLNVVSLSSSSLLDSPTISQSHALIVDALSQLDSLDETLLSQTAQLIIDNLSSLSSSDEISLGVGDVVSVDSLDSVNTLDNLVLTENAVLLTNPLNNSQSLSFVVFGIVPELEAYTITFSQQSDKISYNIDLIKVKFGE